MDGDGGLQSNCIPLSKETFMQRKDHIWTGFYPFSCCPKARVPND